MIKSIKRNVFQLHFENFGSCIYVLKLDKLTIIDTSSKENQDEILADLKQLDIDPEDIDVILLTHTHWDHTGNFDLFKNADIYGAKDIDKIKKDIPELEIIESPGHTRDSICFLYKGILFSGDTIFYRGIGRTDLPESDPAKMKQTLENLKKVKYKILCPGHIEY
jgi:glyoxylase-like metal-dependent hydrolase (beta-lactamase superfamily II)